MLAGLAVTTLVALEAAAEYDEDCLDNEDAREHSHHHGHGHPRPNPHPGKTDDGSEPGG